MLSGVKERIQHRICALIQWVMQYLVHPVSHLVMVMEEIRLVFYRLFFSCLFILQLFRINTAGQMSHGEWCVTVWSDRLKSDRCEFGHVDGPWVYDKVC